MPMIAGLRFIGVTAVAISIHAAASPIARPGIGGLLAASDTVVIGRVVSVVAVPMVPGVIRPRRIPDHVITIRVDSALKRPSTLLPGNIRVQDHGDFGPGKNAFAIFFFHCLSGQGYVPAGIDIWTLPAKQVFAGRGVPAADPLRAVIREMIAILGTSGGQMFDPTAGVNYTTYPMRNRFDSIYFVAARALWDVPDNLVEAPLRQIARERDALVRLWAASCLIKHGFF